MQISKNLVSLMYVKGAEEAANFYAKTFPDSSVGKVHKAPTDYPSRKAGDVLMVEFTTDDQKETDKYWNAIVENGGQESDCGWCKDKWGLSWQITPRTLTEGMAKGGDEAKRVFSAMMTMKKIDVAMIDAARKG